MGGYGAAVVGGIVQGAGVAVAAGGAAYEYLKKGTGGDADEGSQGGKEGSKEVEEVSKEVGETSKEVYEASEEDEEEQPSVKAA